MFGHKPFLALSDSKVVLGQLLVRTFWATVDLSSEHGTIDILVQVDLRLVEFRGPTTWGLEFRV